MRGGKERHRERGQRELGRERESSREREIKEDFAQAKSFAV